MKRPNTNYRKFVDDVLKKYEDVVPLKFEDISTGLPHREFLLVVYSIAKQRPTNREIIRILWDYVRDTDKDVPDYIYEFAMEANMSFAFRPQGTERYSMAQSKAKSGRNHPQYDGDIYAVNIEDRTIKAITSSHQMRELGFFPKSVYACIDGKALTHKGHVFIRDKEDSYDYTKRKSD